VLVLFQNRPKTKDPTNEGCRVFVLGLQLISML